MKIRWDDETCLIFAQALDREDAALMGEPSPRRRGHPPAGPVRDAA